MDAPALHAGCDDDRTRALREPVGTAPDKSPAQLRGFGSVEEINDASGDMFVRFDGRRYWVNGVWAFQAVPPAAADSTREVIAAPAARRQRTGAAVAELK